MKFRFLLMLTFLILAIVGCAKSDGQSKGTAKEVKSDYPNKPIEFIIPYPPGGGTDIVGRALVNHIHKYLPNDENVVVVNKPGGSGVVGATELMKAKPDGYQIGLIPTSVITIQPQYGETAYDYDDFEPVIKVATSRQLLLVQKDAPWLTLEEWLSYVKENPGKFTFGTAGVGGAQHIAMEMLNNAANVETKNVPFDGIGPAKAALLGGHVQGVVAALNNEDKDSIKALFSFSGEKGEATQDVPLLKDEGIDVELDIIHGIYVPKGTPDDIIKVLHDAFKQTLEDPEFIEEFKKTQLDITYASAEGLKEEIEKQYTSISSILDKLNMNE